MTEFSSVLIGENALLIQCAEILLSAGGSIASIATETASIKDWAVDRGIPVIDSGADLTAQLIAFDYDWLFSIANLRIIPQEVCARAGRGAINFHDGPLPEFAGLNTPSWAIIEGRTVHGVSWHDITVGVDEGDVHVRRAIEISPDETALTLNTKCFEAGIATFAELVSDIATGRLQRHRQDLSRRSYCPRARRPAAAATLCFNQPAAAISALVRALSFGAGYANPLAVPKLQTDSGLFRVLAATVLDEPASGVPGEVISIQKQGIVICAADAPVLVEAVRQTPQGTVAIQQEVIAGARLPLPSEAEQRSLDEALSRVVGHERAFRRRILQAEDISLDGIGAAASAAARPRSLPLRRDAATDSPTRQAVLLAFLARLCARAQLDVAYTTSRLTKFCAMHPGYFASSVPLRIDAQMESSVEDVIDTALLAIAETDQKLTYPLDLIERIPVQDDLRLSVGMARMSRSQDAQPVEGCALTFVVADDQDLLIYDAERVAEEKAHEIADRLAIFLGDLAMDELLKNLPLTSAQERQNLLYERNASQRSYDDTVCVQDLVRTQAELTPEAVAVSYAGQSITYRELEDRACRIAHALKAKGAKPDTIIGLYLPRSIDLVVGAYGILKSGACYLPLDPAFPADRLALMVADSEAGMVLTTRSLSLSGSIRAPSTLDIEELGATPVGPVAEAEQCRPHNLAYVIYTSGSTGRPKGVMVEHRNVVNFFAGMDDRIARSGNGQDVWLAVTSLSFDISVLEIFWTLARGFKVVIHASEVDEAKGAASRRRPVTDRSMDFSLFYWGNDDGVGVAKYKTLLDGARFADENGFQAVWTPERHFHAFGGPYPNPAVTGAAVAAVTKNLAIRAGSCVLPLHHPARVAEEWAVVDNLSGGRVGLAFASGWMPEDFVLRPENAPPANRAALLRDIETVRRLWRGDAVEFDLGERKISVVTQPRPLSRELPIWVTTAGNPDTYRDAARLGANVLTHLLGQSIEELAGKISIYRQTLAETGRNPAQFKVTVMLHTLVGADRKQVRDLARGPMKDYLRSAAALIKQYAWAFPAFKKPAGASNPMDVDLQSLAPEEMDAILEFAFLRYFEDSGLFGTVDDATDRVEQLRAIGVDEIACLIDFGVASETVLEALKPLADVVRVSRSPAPAQVERGLAADIRREHVTHLQCTPSMAGMFLADADDRAALASLSHMFVGGEALKSSLLAQLRQATKATITNMYGPTETTIWSSTSETSLDDDVAPLGRPIANTQLYVLDPFLQPVPAGIQGELFIGGDGVTRGYLHREELTQQRFLPNPFAPGRMYRTGDSVRYDEKGNLAFLGRNDNQVKIRGNRIELGEIEARIAEFAGVRDAVVVVREDRPGDKRIVAYLRATRPIAFDQLKAKLGTNLPEYMVPSHFMVLDAFPLTPNAKIDRAQLPPPKVEMIEIDSQPEAAMQDVERSIADTFQRTLGVARVGLHDNFFALGGHSLLAVQAHRELKIGIAPQLTITDLFRFPTVAALAKHVAGTGVPDRQLSQVAERAAMRRAAMESRRVTTRTTNAV